MNIPRLYYHYKLWEEYHYKMWVPITGIAEEDMFKRVFRLISNHKRYGRYMLKIIDKWYYSCAVNLSNVNINRQAWVGQAACCLAVSCPEMITRRAWQYLSWEKQELANNEADIAIEIWETKFIRGYQLCLNLI